MEMEKYKKEVLTNQQNFKCKFLEDFPKLLFLEIVCGFLQFEDLDGFAGSCKKLEKLLA